MTDRFRTLTVTLDQELREDDAQAIIDAIKQIRHVADVRPKVATMGDDDARIQASIDLRSTLSDFVYELLDAYQGLDTLPERFATRRSRRR